MTNIYVGNLAYQTTAVDLQNAFGKFGQVTGANVVSDRDTGRSKGFGFVEMTNADEAKAAIDSLNNKEMDGRTLKVNAARTRE